MKRITEKWDNFKKPNICKNDVTKGEKKWEQKNNLKR